MLNFLRRSHSTFIRKAAIRALASVNIPQIVTTALLDQQIKKIELHKDDVVLLQGDSITDWHRSRTVTTGHNSAALGVGYSYLVGTELLIQYPDKNLTILNRGIGGDKVPQLAARWNIDCMAIKPNVLSILIGVNDFWSIATQNYTGTLADYRKGYTNLLDGTMALLPDVKLIIGEPFALKGVKVADDTWYPEFDEYRMVAREIAVSFNATFIPYQSIFNEAIKTKPGKYWTFDGVHPTVAGESLMANAWMETIKR